MGAGLSRPAPDVLHETDSPSRRSQRRRGQVNPLFVRDVLLVDSRIRTALAQSQFAVSSKASRTISSSVPLTKVCSGARNNGTICAWKLPFEVKDRAKRQVIRSRSPEILETRLCYPGQAGCEVHGGYSREIQNEISAYSISDWRRGWGPYALDLRHLPANRIV